MHPTTQPRLPSDPAPWRVLFVASNGAGLGHLTRMMAVARHLPALCAVRFFSFAATPFLEEQELEAEFFHVGGHDHSSDWNHALHRRFGAAISDFRPNIVVIDSTNPYPGLLAALAEAPDTAVVWSRRGMWRKGRVNYIMDGAADFFDLIVEPGDAASTYDVGATSRHPADATVEPVTFLDPDEMLERREARRALGIAQDANLALVQLGAGVINDIESLQDTCVRQLVGNLGWQVVCTSNPRIAADPAFASHVHCVQQFPLARLLPAFDLVVSASGYNSFHETLAAGVPAVFIPNLSTGLDDQAARAQWAADQGLALVTTARTPGDLVATLNLAVDTDVRAQMARRSGQFQWPNGARSFAACISTTVTNGLTASERTRRRTQALQRLGYAEPFAASGAPAQSSHRSLAKSIRPLLAKLDPHRTPTAMARVSEGVFMRLPRAVRVTMRRLALQLDPASPSVALVASTGANGPARPTARQTAILVVLEPHGDNDETVRSVAALQEHFPHLAPVFLLRTPGWAAVKSFGFDWDYLPVDGDDPDAGLAERVEELTGWYRIEHVADGAKLDELAQWLAGNS